MNARGAAEGDGHEADGTRPGTPRAEGSDADLIAVGAGPQLLRALADLEGELQVEASGRVSAPAPVRVIAVDPHEPGAGAVWRVDQPTFLGMNVAAAAVDLRCPSVPWDLLQWHARDRGAPCERYPSRAVVGRYLRWAWERLSRSPLLRLAHVRGTVVDVAPVSPGWQCRIERDGRTEVLAAPRVLLSTGHREPAPFDHAALVADDGSAAAGRTVVVGGAALTAFDAVLCLTEGRGGRWDAASGAGAVPRYRPSGREPGRVVLVSRSGRMMLPKPAEPSPAVAAAVAGLRERWTRGDPLDDGWWGTLLEAASRAASAHHIDLDTGAASAWLDDPPALVDSAAVAQRWRADLRRAAGDVDTDPAWWLGRAWAAAYPDLLASIERRDRSPQPWATFRARAATLERWAFGPPAALVARLVALLESGHLELTTDAAAPTDVVAHIAPPGVLPRPRPWDVAGPRPWRPGLDEAPPSRVWSGLLAGGHVTVRPGESGVLTTPEGTCLSAGGTPSAGLSALGRPTEGPVVDHDSLQRRLHLDALRWAAGTAQALADRPHLSSERPRQESTAP